MTTPMNTPAALLALDLIDDARDEDGAMMQRLAGLVDSTPPDDLGPLLTDALMSLAVFSAGFVEVLDGLGDDVDGRLSFARLALDASGG